MCLQQVNIKLLRSHMLWEEVQYHKPEFEAELSCNRGSVGMCQASWERLHLMQDTGRAAWPGCASEQSSSSFICQGWLNAPCKHGCKTPPTGQGCEAPLITSLISLTRCLLSKACRHHLDIRADQDGPILFSEGWHKNMPLTQTGRALTYYCKMNIYLCLLWKCGSLRGG